MSDSPRRIGLYPINLSRGTLLRDQVLAFVREERANQIKQHGYNHDQKLGFGGSVSSYPWLEPYTRASSSEIQEKFRAEYESYSNRVGRPSWMHLIREEVAELFDTDNIEDAVAEAIQVAALCVSLVEHLYTAHEGDFQ